MILPAWLCRLLGQYAIKAKDRAGRPFHGRVTITGTIEDPGSPDDGKIVVFQDRNTITLDSKGIMARALAGDPDGKITTVHWGDGNNPEAKEDTDLEHYLTSSAVASGPTYPDVDSVMFTATIAPGTGTGNRYSEIGLKAANGKLFARFTFAGIDKLAKLRLSVTWQIVFVR